MHAFIHSPIIRDIFICISLLTRLPVQLDERAYDHRGAAGWAFPLVGVVVGTASALIGILCLILGFGPNISAGFVVMTSLIITGAMHADGLADCRIDPNYWPAMADCRRIDAGGNRIHRLDLGGGVIARAPTPDYGAYSQCTGGPWS